MIIHREKNKNKIIFKFNQKDLPLQSHAIPESTNQKQKQKPF